MSILSKFEIVVTTHALQRFRERALGHPDDANEETLRNVLSRARTIELNDPEIIIPKRVPSWRYLFDRATQMVLCVKSENRKWKIVTCWRFGDIPDAFEERMERVQYGEEFLEWWKTVEALPNMSNVGAVKRFASSAFAAGRLSVKGKAGA